MEVEPQRPAVSVGACVFGEMRGAWWGQVMLRKGRTHPGSSLAQSSGEREPLRALRS